MKPIPTTKCLTLRECIGYLYGIDILSEDIELARLQYNDGESSLVEISTIDPTELDINNREEIHASILLGESIKMLLIDDIGTTEADFDALVESGQIKVESSDPEVVSVDELTLHVEK